MNPKINTQKLRKVESNTGAVIGTMETEFDDGSKSS